MEISLVDVVNLVHPKPTAKMKKALKALVEDTLKPANTWEVALSQGADKKQLSKECLLKKFGVSGNS